MRESYRQINYALRPAKSVERKMIATALSRLRPFHAIEKMRYVGFGSTYFSDFKVFHSSLGIKNMLSIEADVKNKDRFLFNRPFGFVEIEFGRSSEVLDRIALDIPSIYWLDYDGELTAEILQDVTRLAQNVCAGSVAIFSINVDSRGIENSNLLEKLTQAVGEKRIHPSWKNKDLAGWGLAGVCHEIIDSEIREALTVRKTADFEYRQLFNFHYRDGARMLTVGGLFLSASQQHLASSCGFNELNFIREGKTAFEIPAPNLTRREIDHLNQHMPSPTSSFLPLKEVEAFKMICQYFPSFSETAPH